MQKFVYCLLFVACYFTGTAQQSRFIYIQTENKQPFYVKVDKKLFSSLASGYVIIPKLTDGTYNLSIGFPKNESPVQNIQCSIDKKDQGYLLKNFGEKGWGLFNLQTLNVLMPSATVQSAPPVIVNKTDTFSTMLSEVVNDPTIKQVVQAPKIEPVKKEEPKIEVITPIEPAKPEEPIVAAKTETITRTLFNTNAEGTEAIYIDKNGDQLDTIRIFIPAEKVQPKPVEVKTEPAKEPLKEIVKEEQTKVVEEQKPVVQESKPIVEDSKPVVQETKPEVQEPQKEKVATNPNCTDQATDADFLKLRKKMASADSDEDMIAVAKKAFKSKCFTTAQIKNLSFFFLKDEGKYQFFDAAYTHVSDKKEFKDLQSQLVDEYYINRFKVMIQ